MLFILTLSRRLQLLPEYAVCVALFCCDITESMKKMGYEVKEIEDSLKQGKYDDLMATYLLLGRKHHSDVSVMLVRGLPTSIILYICALVLALLAAR